MKSVPKSHTHSSFSKVLLDLGVVLVGIRTPDGEEFPGVRIVNCANRLVISPLKTF
jgi:hypothetical protein